ncbi:MAG: hypothetical protein KKA64_04550 [Nanoarchaeota archaeon]|nr:hypothetical protein [Nanoarchaeota archaeon]
MESFTKDLEELIEFLSKKYNIKLNNKSKKIIKELHEKVYSFCLIDFELKRKTNVKTFFLSEARSDSIKLIPLLLLGFRKPIFLLRRSMVEGVLKFIFYEEHPIEYKLLDINVKSKYDIDELFDYVKKHPLSYNNKRIEDLASKIKGTYSDLSRFIHATNTSFSSSRKTLQDVKIKENELERFSSAIKILLQDLMTLVLYFRKEDINLFDVENKRFIFNNLSRTGKRIIHNLN